MIKLWDKIYPHLFYLCLGFLVGSYLSDFSTIRDCLTKEQVKLGYSTYSCKLEK